MNSRPTNKIEKQYYLVTEDLSLLVQRFCKDQKIPEKETQKKMDSTYFDQLLDSLGKVIQKTCFANPSPDGIKVEVKALPKYSFSDLLHKHDMDEDNEPKEFWICLDDVYPTPSKHISMFHLSITRLVDEHFNPIGYGTSVQKIKWAIILTIKSVIA